jgi:hypothetical protein
VREVVAIDPRLAAIRRCRRVVADGGGFTPLEEALPSVDPVLVAARSGPSVGQVREAAQRSVVEQRTVDVPALVEPSESPVPDQAIPAAVTVGLSSEGGRPRVAPSPAY